MKDFSVEISHIYTNSQIPTEQQLSQSLAIPLVKGYQAENKTYSLVVMVDDYSFPDPDFDYEAFLAWLSDQDTPVDHMIRESQLIPVCDEVVKQLSDPLRHEITDYVQNKRKYPCSLFIAAWYLLRLGKIDSPLLAKELTAKRLVNILPESFQPFEEKGFELIEATEYSDAKSSIENIYIRGREID